MDIMNQLEYLARQCGPAAAAAKAADEFLQERLGRLVAHTANHTIFTLLCVPHLPLLPTAVQRAQSRTLQPFPCRIPLVPGLAGHSGYRPCR